MWRFCNLGARIWPFLFFSNPFLERKDTKEYKFGIYFRLTCITQKRLCLSFLIIKQEQKREAGADLGLILTDFLNERRRPKLLRGSGACPNGKFFSILTSQSPLSWVSESFRQDNLASSFSSDEAFQLNTSIMKNLTDFSKTVETVWIPAWQACKARFLVEIAYYHRTTNVVTRDENGSAIVAFIKKNGLLHLCIYL